MIKGSTHSIAVAAVVILAAVVEVAGENQVGYKTEIPVKSWFTVG
jgi:hypothetical protein